MAAKQLNPVIKIEVKNSWLYLPGGNRAKESRFNGEWRVKLNHKTKLIHVTLNGKSCRNFRLENGFLFLEKGSDNKYHIHFNNLITQEFLDRFGIDFVRHENPNQTYIGPGDWHAVVFPGSKTEFEILTDGGTYSVLTNAGRSIQEQREHTVTNASFAIVCRYVRGQYRRVILYSLESLPDLESKIKKILGKNNFLAQF